MSGKDLEVIDRAVEDLGCAEGDVVVAGAVEAVAADRVVLVEFVGESVEVGVARDGVVEGGVEDGDLGDSRVEVAGDADAGGLGGIVKWGERAERLNAGEDLVVNEDGGREFLAAVNDAMADGVRGEAGADEF